MTPWNVEYLRKLVVRGSEQHPGAAAVEDEQGRLLNLAGMPLAKREAVAKTLLATGVAGGAATKRKHGSSGRSSGSLGEGKVVYRHLVDGDIMLTNRQPTLHKPGLMAHRARVLKSEKTIRMHYANCSTFNADFDGDEINLHLPQVRLLAVRRVLPIKTSPLP